MAEQEEKPIRVVDRRMFTPEGELRPDFQPVEEPSEPAQEPPAAPPPPRQEPGKGERPAETQARGQFAAFIEFLAVNASSALQHGNPRIAKQMIDWLAMLEQKTRGNLSFEESNFLASILYELRLAYVEVSRPAPK